MRVRIALILFAVAVVTLFSSFNPPVRCRAILLQAAGPGPLPAAAPTPPAIPEPPPTPAGGPGWHIRRDIREGRVLLPPTEPAGPR